MNMMPNNTYENLRNRYKPDNIRVLFIGESRPQAGAFFYQEDSALYSETRNAFNTYFAQTNLTQTNFTLENFKLWKCWLYDICDDPVNGMNDAQRRASIRANIPRLVELVRQEKPEFIIVCKRGAVESEIRNSYIMHDYREDENIFFLPFPLYNHVVSYREGLITALDLMCATTTHF